MPNQWERLHVSLGTCSQPAFSIATQGLQSAAVLSHLHRGQPARDMAEDPGQLMLETSMDYSLVLKGKLRRSRILTAR